MVKRSRFRGDQKSGSYSSSDYDERKFPKERERDMEKKKQQADRKMETGRSGGWVGGGGVGVGGCINCPS